MLRTLLQRVRRGEVGARHQHVAVELAAVLDGLDVLLVNRLLVEVLARIVGPEQW